MCAAPESDTNAPLGLSSETPPWCGISFLYIWRMPPYSNVTVPLLSERCPLSFPRATDTKAVTTNEANEDRLGTLSLNLSWNVPNEDAGPLPVWGRSVLGREGSLALIPASAAGVQYQPQDSLSGGDGFTQAQKICNQCVLLWVTFFPLEGSAFCFATRKDVLILFLMASNLLTFIPATSCW